MTLSLQDLLDRKRIPYKMAPSGQGIEVQDHVSTTEAVDFPEDTTIFGNLHLSNWPGQRLPGRLLVKGHLLLAYTRLTDLPPDLTIEGDLILAWSKIQCLPEGLRVPGTLCLGNTGIRAMPAGLRVGGDLNLRGTRITRLPPDLQVDGDINPPEGLADIHAFMREQTPSSVVLGGAVTHHERLALRARLDAFPDLCRVALAMTPGSQMTLLRRPDGHCAVHWDRT